MNSIDTNPEPYTVIRVIGGSSFFTQTLAFAVKGPGTRHIGEFSADDAGDVRARLLAAELNSAYWLGFLHAKNEVLQTMKAELAARAEAQ